MAKISKRRAAQLELLGDRTTIPLVEALEIVKQTATAKFDESVDMSLNLGIDSRKSDQVVRGATVLPNGAGKSVRIAVFAQGEAATKASEAGADEVGMEDLAEKMKGGDLNFDVVIAAPDAMRVVGALGQVLGPRGLMPNPKVGTVTPDVAGAVENARKGQVRFRVDKGGIIHCAVGKASFSAEALQENIQAVIAEVQKLKPAAAKGIYLDRMTVSSTMGLGVSVDVSTL